MRGIMISGSVVVYIWIVYYVLTLGEKIVIGIHQPTQIHSTTTTYNHK